MTNWVNNIARKILLLATMLLIGYCYAHAQIGGPDLPVFESTHRYQVAMDRTVNSTAWFVYSGGIATVTDVAIVNGTITPYRNLGAGTKSGGLSYVDITFDPPTYVIGNTYTIVYEELEPTGNQCQARRFYEITIQSYFRANITDWPDDACLIEPVSHHTIADPRNTTIEHVAVYEIENTEPADYAHPWSFTFNFSSNALRTGFASPNISQVDVNIDGTTTTYNPNTPDYENYATAIPADVTAVITVTYQVLPGSAHNVTLMITNMKGSYEDYDPVSPKQQTHTIQKLPAPSAITAID